MFDFGCDGSAGDFKFGAALMVTAVLLHLSKRGRVFKAVCHFCQGVVGSPSGLEQFDKPVW